MLSSLSLLGNGFLQVAALTYLYNRNDTWDRKNIVFHGPFIVLVFIEFLFNFINTNMRHEKFGFQDPSLHDCSFSNRFLTFLMAGFFLFLPYWFNQVARFETKVHDTEYIYDKKALPLWEEMIGRAPKSVWNSIKLMSLGTTVSYYGCMFTLFYVYFLSGGRDEVSKSCQGFLEPCNFLNNNVQQPVFAICTTKSHAGGFTFPFLIWSNVYVQYLLIILFFASLGSFQYLPRPTLIPTAMAMVVWSAILFIWIYNEAWSSHWIPYVSIFLCGVYFIEPKIVKMGKVLDTDMLERSKEAYLRRGLYIGGIDAWWKKKMSNRQAIFRLLWERFILWKWQPWRDKTEEIQEEELQKQETRATIAAHAAATAEREERNNKKSDDLNYDSSLVGSSKGIDELESGAKSMSR
jgi:hypothetical protein